MAMQFCYPLWFAVADAISGVIAVVPATTLVAPQTPLPYRQQRCAWTVLRWVTEIALLPASFVHNGNSVGVLFTQLLQGELLGFEGAKAL